MNTTIKLEKIIAAIVAMEQAIPIAYHGSPGLTGDLIMAKVGLEFAIRDIQFQIKEAA